MTNSEGGESLFSKWAYNSPLSLRRFDIRVRAAPGTNHFVHFVAFHGVGATACDHSRGLIGKLVGRIDNLIFQRDLVTNMLAIADFANLPLFLSHSTPPVYKRHFKINKRQLLVTGVTNRYDKPPIVDET